MAFVRKASDEVRTSDGAVLADDSDLVIACSANTFYRLDALIRWYSGGTPDFKYLWKYTGTIVWASLSQLENSIPIDNGDFSNAGANMDQTAFATNYLTAGSARVHVGNATTTNRAAIWLKGHFRTNTSGNFSFQWAQNTSSVSPTTVYTSSYLYIVPVTDAGAP